MIKSFFKGLLFNFDQITFLVVGNYDDIIENFDDDELYDFTMESYSRFEELIGFMHLNFGEDYYIKEFRRELKTISRHIAIDKKNIRSFQMMIEVDRINLLTATFDYVKQFIMDDGVDSAFMYKLYKECLKKKNLTPLMMV